jgi:hypothetical protein
MPPLDRGTRPGAGACLTNRWRGVACACAVVTRVAAMAVSTSETADMLVLAVWRQSSWIGLVGPAKKTPVVGNVNVRGIPNW